MTALICHKLGHYLGGAPKKFRGNTTRRSWASAEGQADYFLAAKCLPYFWPNEKENQAAVEKLDPRFKDELKPHCRDNLCMRVLSAGHNMMEIFASLRENSQVPTFREHDRSTVEQTILRHPSLQCRLDTILSATYCIYKYKTPFDPQDEKIGACLKNEKHPMYKGPRPYCWFLPPTHWHK